MAATRNRAPEAASGRCRALKPFASWAYSPWDAPALDVRLPGLESRGPRRVVLTGDRGFACAGWQAIASPAAIADLAGDHLLVEGGAQTAAAFLRAGLVDRLLLYRAPILIGGGMAALGDIGVTDLGQAHGRWHRHDARQLGRDRVEVYEAA